MKIINIFLLLAGFLSSLYISADPLKVESTHTPEARSKFMIRGIPEIRVFNAENIYIYHSLDYVNSDDKNKVLANTLRKGTDPTHIPKVSDNQAGAKDIISSTLKFVSQRLETNPDLSDEKRREMLESYEARMVESYSNNFKPLDEILNDILLLDDGSRKDNLLRRNRKLVVQYAVKGCGACEEMTATLQEFFDSPEYDFDWLVIDR